MDLRHEILDAMRGAEGRVRHAAFPERTLVVDGLSTTVAAFAGADATGSWVLALSTLPSSPPPSHVRMAVLAVEFGAAYILDQRGERTHIRTSVLRCNSEDLDIRQLFATFCASLVAALPDSPSERDVSSAVDKWLGLFWRLQAPARTDVVGLVGELAMIMAAPDAAGWVRAWHGDPTSTVDFVFSNPRFEVEVKATQSPQRVHHLSADQAYGSADRYVASVQVDLRASGIALRDAVASIESRLQYVEDISRFRDILAAECGSQYPEFMRERFVPEVSTASLAFFRLDDIPRPDVQLPLPAGVRAMSFTSDFTGAPSLGAAAFFGRQRGF